MVLNLVYFTVLTSVITSQLQFGCKHREATVIVILCYINKTELNSNMSLHVATSIFYIQSGVLSLNV